MTSTAAASASSFATSAEARTSSAAPPDTVSSGKNTPSQQINPKPPVHAPVEPPLGTDVAVRLDRDGIELSLPSSTKLHFHAQWLWHNAEAHRHPDSGQLTMDPRTLAGAKELASVSLAAVGGVTGGTAVRVTWNGGATHDFPLETLLALRHDYEHVKTRMTRAQPPTMPCLSAPRPATVKSNAAAAPASPADDQGSSSPKLRHTGKEEVPCFAYDDIMRSEEAVYEWTAAINRCGLAIVTGAPEQPPVRGADGRGGYPRSLGEDGTTVTQVAARICSPQLTLYGSSWDVAVMPKPINIAYAPVSLDLHIDLVYYESPPGLQLLHCTRFDDRILGGESTFMDGLAAARDFARQHPEHFDALATLPTTFQKVHYNRSSPAHMVAAKPIFQLNRYGIEVDARRNGGTPPSDLSPYVVGINWAPQFEGPLRLCEEDVGRYYEAYTCFSAFLKAREREDGGRLLIEYRMREGEVSVFNNRRMLHGRRHFTSTDNNNDGSDGRPAPQRVLKGCYLNIDDYRSRLAYLSGIYGPRSKGGDAGKASAQSQREAREDVHLVCNGNWF